MKKKILILIMCICMIVPMFAFASFADTASALVDNWNYQYGVAEGYLYRSGTGGTDQGDVYLEFGGGIANARVYLYLNCGDKTYEFDSLHYNYDYLTLAVGSSDVDRVNISLSSPGSVSFYTVQLNGEELSISDGDKIITWDVSSEPCKYKLVLLYNDSSVISGNVSDFFPLSNNFEWSAFYRLTENSLPYSMYSGNNYEVSQPKNLISLLMGSLGISAIGLAGGIKESVSNLIYVDPNAETKTLSAFSIFVFTIAGLAIAMTVFWLIFRLIRFGRQR